MNAVRRLPRYTGVPASALAGLLARPKRSRSCSRLLTCWCGVTGRAHWPGTAWRRRTSTSVTRTCPWSRCPLGSGRAWAQRRGFDSLVRCSTGIADAEGSAGKPGALPAQVLDHATGYLAAAAALLALAGVQRGNSSRCSWLSLVQTAQWFMGGGWANRRTRVQRARTTIWSPCPVPRDPYTSSLRSGGSVTGCRPGPRPRNSVPIRRRSLPKRSGVPPLTYQPSGSSR